jgi:hypothetical protein
VNFAHPYRIGAGQVVALCNSTGEAGASNLSTVFSRDRNAKRHDREAGHGPKDESAISSNPNHATPNESNL